MIGEIGRIRDVDIAFVRGRFDGDIIRGSSYKGNIDIPYTEDLLNTASEWFTAAFLLTAASILGMIIILIFYPLSKKKVEEVTVALSGASVNADEMGKGDLNFVAEMRGTASSADGTLSDGENADEDTADDGEDGGGDSPTAIE